MAFLRVDPRVRRVEKREKTKVATALRLHTCVCTHTHTHTHTHRVDSRGEKSGYILIERAF